LGMLTPGQARVVVWWGTSCPIRAANSITSHVVEPSNHDIGARREGGGALSDELGGILDLGPVIDAAGAIRCLWRSTTPVNEMANSFEKLTELVKT